MAKIGRDVFKLPRDEIFSDLPHPSGQGQMICGRAAAKRIAEIAKEAGRRAGVSNRVEFETLRKLTGDLLVERFFRERRELNKQQIDRFLASVGRQAQRDCTNITHFIPCTLMTAQDPETLALGPVQFHNRARFRRIILPRLQDHGKDEEGIARDLMVSAVKFYRKFDWVAEVTIASCDPRTSAKIAERAVYSALDCIHLLLSARYSQKMRVGGPALRTDRRGGVVIDSEGKMHPHGSTSWAGQVNFPKGWSSQLADPNFAHMMSLCALALEAAVDPNLVRPISRRFLDAAQWFGEASRDERPASRVVKYVTSLERMVMTDEMDDISSLLSERIAALCCDRGNASDRKKWREDARRVYDLRSRLVHGSMSPSDPEIESGVWLAAQVSEATLLHALYALGADGLRGESASTKRLAGWYGRVIKMIDEAEAASDSKVS